MSNEEYYQKVGEFLNIPQDEIDKKILHSKSFCEVCGEISVEEEIKICRNCWNNFDIK